MRQILNEILDTDQQLDRAHRLTDDDVATLRALPTGDQVALHGAIREFFAARFGAEMIAPVVNRLGYALRAAAAATAGA